MKKKSIIRPVSKIDPDEPALRWKKKLEAERPIRRAMGQTFRKQREVAGVTCSLMAELAGVSRSTLRRFEEGDPIKRPKVVARSLVNALRNQQFQAVFQAAKQIFPDAFQQLTVLDWMRAPRIPGHIKQGKPMFSDNPKNKMEGK